VRSQGRWAWLPAAPAELVLAGVLLVIAAVGWVSTTLRMGGMDAGLWSYPAGLGLYLATWTAMMAAMMLPAILPTALRYERAILRGPRGPRTALVLSGAFAVGYLAVWSAAGLVPFALLGWAGGLLTGAAGRYAAAGVLVAAAAYQFLPARRACLRRLGAPRADGGLGAVRAGLEAGGWCVGCSWTLMAALVALGLMSPTWMIVTWALVMAERLLPSSRLATTGVAAVLAALAVGVG
jgi:predicted metal-binding membrane protein